MKITSWKYKTKIENKCLILLTFKTSFCNFGLSLPKDITSVMFLQQSATMFCDEFPTYHFSWWKYPGGTIPQLRRSLRASLERRSPNGNVKNYYLVT